MPQPSQPVPAAPLSGTRVIVTVEAGRPNLVRKSLMADCAMTASPTTPMVTPVPSTGWPAMPV